MGAYDLLVLGDINPDLVLRGDDVRPVFGQAERIVDEARLTIGGSGAITACGAAVLGLRVAIAGVVGNDRFGTFMREELAARGIDTRGVVVDPNRATGVTVVLSTPGDRAILTAPGTVGDLRGSMIDPELVQVSDHVHVSSYFLQRSLAPDLPELFEQIHERGGTTSIDPNWDPTDAWNGGLTDLLPATDVFLPNQVEALRLARTDDLDEAIERLSAGAPLVVVKVGADGAIAAAGERLIRRPATPAQVVDTTGAGDSFDAGFLAAYTAGSSLEDAIALANACGAMSARSVGGTDGQPTMDQARTVMTELTSS